MTEQVVETINDTVSTTVKVEDSERKRYPKRKYAIMMGFCGTGYHGMQFNPGVPTIEAELLKAFGDIGVVEEFNLDSLSKISFQRCARTDKGVHALGQVVSAKLVIPEDSEEGWLAEKMNAVLPAQIRVWGNVRTNDRFNAKQRCGGRIYEYVIPTYCFRPFAPEEETLFGKELTEEEIMRMKRGFDANGDGIKRENPRKKKSNDDDEDEQGEEEIVDDAFEVSAAEMETIRRYRVTEDRVDKVRQLLKQYEGTHNFHNFTIGRPHWNPSSNRHMFSVTCGDPFVRGNTEWMSIKFHGQAFMLHQIRKMVGFVALMVRLDRPLSLFKELCEPVRVNIPKAPSLGLFLQEPLFDAFNKQTEELRSQLKEFNGGVISFEPFRNEMDKFKEVWIYSKIIEEEEAKNSFESWMRFLIAHYYEFGYLTVDGNVPEIFRKFATEGIYDKNRKSKTAERARDSNKRQKVWEKKGDVVKDEPSMKVDQEEKAEK